MWWGRNRSVIFLGACHVQGRQRRNRSHPRRKRKGLVMFLLMLCLSYPTRACLSLFVSVFYPTRACLSLFVSVFYPTRACLSLFVCLLSNQGLPFIVCLSLLSNQGPPFIVCLSHKEDASFGSSFCFWCHFYVWLYECMTLLSFLLSLSPPPFSLMCLSLDSVMLMTWGFPL